MIDFVLLGFLFITISNMPKRAPTPPLLDDDADYYYRLSTLPTQLDWDIHTDVLKHVRWIAACVGIEPFYAFHYKPKVYISVVYTGFGS